MENKVTLDQNADIYHNVTHVEKEATKATNADRKDRIDNKCKKEGVLDNQTDKETILNKIIISKTDGLETSTQLEETINSGDRGIKKAEDVSIADHPIIGKENALKDKSTLSTTMEEERTTMRMMRHS